MRIAVHLGARMQPLAENMKLSCSDIQCDEELRTYLGPNQIRDLLIGCESDDAWDSHLRQRCGQGRTCW